MAFKDPKQIRPTEMSSVVEDIEVDSDFIDSPDYTKETEYLFSDYNEYYGYYTNIPQVQIIVDTYTDYLIGEGAEGDPITTLILDTLKGSGKQTFNEIIKGMIRDMLIAGDAYAEIIRDDSGNLINIKQHHPGTIRQVYDKMGIITRYEKIDVAKDKKLWTFQPEDIFHLTRNRLADQVHGTSIIEPLKWIIEAKNEILKLTRKGFRRGIYPVRIIEVDSNKDEDLDKVKAEYANAKNDFEAIVVPKGTIGVNTESLNIENTIPFMNYLDGLYYEVSGVPRIVLGNAQELTEAGGKVSTVTFYTRIKAKQKYVEEAIAHQLGLLVNLTLEAEIQNELLSDSRKDGNQNLSFQPNETIAGRGQ